MHPENPECEQDRAEDLLDNWRKYGYVVFPQQRAIYRQIGERIRGQMVLEAGCGSGNGTAMLHRFAPNITGTDKRSGNVAFARALYPWITFNEWDMSNPWTEGYFSAVVCVEVLEHVADPRAALRNLIGAATREVWLSTPNGMGKPRPPENPFHVCEYTVAEMRAMIADAGGKAVEMLSWESFLPLSDDTDVDPLVYRIVL